MADFVSSDDDDILIVNGYAGTGKTTAISSVISVMKNFGTKCVLLAPTGRAAKVLSSYSGMPAFTIHKHIYRQKSVGGDGFGQFTLAPNKDKETLFIVDEVSLIGIEAGQQQSTTAFGTGNLLDDLITFVRMGVECKLILIGDSAQLPPVGLDASPALSKDYMAMMGGTVFAELSTVVRQQQESGILYNATMIRQLQTELDYGPGLMDLCDLGLETAQFDDIERIGGGELIEKISDAYAAYGEDETVILCRSNRRAIKYNMGIRSTVQYKEERLVRGDKLMIVKNCYQFLEDVKGMDYIANGDIAILQKISKYEDRYGLHFAEARISFPDYDDQEIVAKVILDTLESESASLTYEQSNALYQGVNEDYSHITTKKKRYEAVREDKYYNALQLKYADAITCHKSQGGQWRCVFIDNPFWQEELTLDDLKWLYTAITRATEKVYLVNFKDELFAD
ncbi:MAG: AAA family ATPase [Bacteroidales bacterium]|nr:AAA family ATPase [Bacteroidales bacterium]MBQ8855105.1 AAA family ATPase [Bacteroidales bacterium]